MTNLIPPEFCYKGLVTNYEGVRRYKTRGGWGGGGVASEVLLL